MQLRVFVGLLIGVCALNYALLASGAPPAPIPAKADQAAAEEKVERVWGEKLSSARKKRAVLQSYAAEILQLGRDTKDLPTRYVLFEKARQVALDALDPKTVVAAIDELAMSFNVDGLDEATKSLETLLLSQKRLLSTDQLAMAEAGRRMLAEAVEGDRYDLAVKLADICVKCSKGKAADKDKARAQQAERLRKEFAEVFEAQARIAADPTDREAQLVVGKFYAIEKGDWERGLPRLSRSSDPQLKKLAELETQNDESPPKMFELAEQWDLLWKERSNEEASQDWTQLGIRARYWYERVQSKLEPIDSALALARLEVLPKTNELFAIEPVAESPEAAEKAPVAKKTLGREYANSLGMRFCEIPAGQFTMGRKETDAELFEIFPIAPAEREPNRNGDSSDEVPAHAVRITKPFFMGTYEVTQGDFAQFVDATGYRTCAERYGQGEGWDGNRLVRRPEYNWKNNGLPEGSQFLVGNVSWNDAEQFCLWLSELEGRKYRLPTEAEWEYACRAGTDSLFSNGSDLGNATQIANGPDALLLKTLPQLKYTFPGNDSFASAAPVGSLEPNAFGLYDMLGNVWEWTNDYYTETYYKDSKPDDPTGPSWNFHLAVRGGAFNSWPLHCRCAERGHLDPMKCSLSLGFRVVCDETPDRKRKPVAAISKKPAPAKPKLLAAQENFPPPVMEAGNWFVDGEELIQVDSRGATGLYFGSPEWNEYDLSFEAKIDRGAEGYSAVVHCRDRDHCAWLTAGARQNTQFLLESFEGRWPARLVAGSDQVLDHQWHPVVMEIRGNRAICKFDGKEIAKGNLDPYTSGRIGLQTFHAVVRFRNIKVVATDGKALWEGLPDPDLAQSNAK